MLIILLSRVNSLDERFFPLCSPAGNLFHHLTQYVGVKLVCVPKMLLTACSPAIHRFFPTFIRFRQKS